MTAAPPPRALQAAHVEPRHGAHSYLGQPRRYAWLSRSLASQLAASMSCADVVLLSNAVPSRQISRLAPCCRARRILALSAALGRARSCGAQQLVQVCVAGWQGLCLCWDTRV